MRSCEGPQGRRRSPARPGRSPRRPRCPRGRSLPPLGSRGSCGRAQRAPGSAQRVPATASAGLARPQRRPPAPRVCPCVCRVALYQTRARTMPGCCGFLWVTCESKTEMEKLSACNVLPWKLPWAQKLGAQSRALPVMVAKRADGWSCS